MRPQRAIFGVVLAGLLLAGVAARPVFPFRFHRPVVAAPGTPLWTDTYTNGVLATVSRGSAGVYAWMSNTTVYADIGGQSGYYLVGLLDSVAVYPYVLSVGDILSNYVWRVPTNYMAAP